MFNKPSEKKGRVITNIKDFNKIIENDAYFIFL